MPHYYQFYEDFIKNEERLSIKRAVTHLTIPYLIIHGNHDTSVLIDEAESLHRWNKKSKLKLINDANHVFGAQHPWNKDSLPEHLNQVVTLAIDFLK
ncbi:alpha/beta fold hydrolase [Thalassobellus suaedae]|uniref:Uncharacterized protein n=1 Tax=Thalassobellus suaedae TaxID=3074124 RepID=A0ABY9XS47_9FLAO|nr:hypothetical protein RHP51_17020 [Flavobacteriaceae bacterium HL-DH14]